MLREPTRVPPLDRALAVVPCNTGALVFDWNGTVVDDLARATVATGATLHRFGLARIDQETFQDRFRLPMAAFFQDLGIDAANCDSAIAIWNHELSRGETRLQPGVRELIDRSLACGLLVGVVSAASDEAVAADMRAHSLSDAISFAFGSVRDKTAALLAIADSLADPIVYIGDTEYDMEAAVAAGVVGLAYTGGYRPAEALANAGASALIDDYADLSEFIAAWHR